MIYIVYQGQNNKDLPFGTILYRADAWEQNGLSKAKRFIRSEGWVFIKQQITLNGDMILWVE